VEPANFAIKPCPLRPTGSQHGDCNGAEKMDFGTWEFVLSNGSQADQDTVWNAIKGSRCRCRELSSRPQRPSLTSPAALTTSTEEGGHYADLRGQSSVAADSERGASLDFQGNPASYTPNPFMMTMDKANC